MIMKPMKNRPKYIKSAIFWNRCAGENGAWLRISDLNLITESNDEYYMFAASGRPKFIIREAYPYENWMEEHIGTNKNLKEDSRFKREEQ